MRAHRVGLRLAAVALLGLVISVGCSKNNSGSSSQILLGVSGTGAGADSGLALSANPLFVFIDPADPATPTDPNHGNERYGTTALLAIALDGSGLPQVGLGLNFAAAAGVLASGGDTIPADASGRALDTLRVYQSDPDSFQVSVTDGSRITAIYVHKLVVSPPVAIAGPDQVVQCTGDSSAHVTLDGSASTDPNGDITSWEWFEHFGAPEQLLLGTGEYLDVVLPVGEHLITLRVTDATGKSSTDSVVVRVVDSFPPTVQVSITPARLWPPNHKLVPIHVTLDVLECGSYTVSLESVTSSEPDNGLGDGDTTNDIQGVSPGTEDYDFELRAERAGGGSGRIYRIVYRIVDASGNETIARTRVVVPHDQGGK